MKKLPLLLATCVIALTGCDPIGIKCETLSIKDGSTTLLNVEKTFTTKSVYEYVELGKDTKIYLNAAPRSYVTDPDSGLATDEYLMLKLFKDHFDDTGRLFTFSKYVGKVKLSQDYFLDLSKRKVDIVLHYERLQEVEYNQTDEEKAENADAFIDIKKSYYSASDYYGRTSEFSLYEDTAKIELESHQFLIYGDSASVAYTEAKD